MEDNLSNEELYEMYHNGDKLVLGKLFEQNKEFLKWQVLNTIWHYYSLISESDVFDDLYQIVLYEFYRRIESGDYDPDKGKLTTYVTPYMKYAMLDYVGRVCTGKPGRIFQLILKCKALYADGVSIRDISEQVGITQGLVTDYLLLPLYRSSIDISEDEDSTDVVSEDTIDSGEPSPDRIIDRQISIEYLEIMFDRLSAKDKQVLGMYYGAFGHTKMTAEEIGDYMMISRDAVMKSVAKSTTALKEMYGDNSDLLRWKCAKRMIRKVQRKI